MGEIDETIWIDICIQQKNWGRASPICAVFDSLVLDLKKESYTLLQKIFLVASKKNIDLYEIMSSNF